MLKLLNYLVYVTYLISPLKVFYEEQHVETTGILKKLTIKMRKKQQQQRNF
jgi:hypothetical protein